MGGAVTTIVAIIGAWATVDPWPSVGWTTPNQHNIEVAALQAEIDGLREESVSGIKDFRDEWKCDEYDEELDDLLDRQDAGDDSAKLAEEIRKIRKKMEDTKCSRFEDFG